MLTEHCKSKGTNILLPLLTRPNQLGRVLPKFLPLTVKSLRTPTSRLSISKAASLPLVPKDHSLLTPLQYISGFISMWTGEVFLCLTLKRKVKMISYHSVYPIYLRFFKITNNLYYFHFIQHKNEGQLLYAFSMIVRLPNFFYKYSYNVLLFLIVCMGIWFFFQKN